MPTLFGRLYAHHKKTNKPILNLEQRKELGEQVKEEFFSKFKLPAWKIPQVEDGQVFKVLNYHQKFTRRMDEMIKEYYEKKNIEAVKSEAAAEVVTG